MNLLRPFKLKPAPFTGLLHIALVIILIGACVTHFFGEQGQVHLRLAQTTSLSTSHSTLSIYLWDFYVENYPDYDAPMDYVSELRILDRGDGRNKADLQVDNGAIRMNKPLRYHHYRFCELDYDTDRQGVTLSYNYDPWGIGITYTGYALLLVAMIGFFFQRHTVFRSLWNKRHKVLVLVLAVLFVVLTVVMTLHLTPKPPRLPVLHTPLLAVHVSVIMMAYSIFACIMVNGILGLCVKKWREKLMNLSRVLIYPAVCCLTAGIFIGAVWANMSWGRYWGWDPKETWALITLFVYAGLLHAPILLPQRWLSGNKRQVAYHICTIVAFCFVLFTYFGVNHLLGGLHSYA